MEPSTSSLPGNHPSFLCKRNRAPGSFISTKLTSHPWSRDSWLSAQPRPLLARGELHQLSPTHRCTPNQKGALALKKGEKWLYMLT